MPKKKYSINWENDEPSSFEVDGIPYNSLDDIQNEKDRNKLAAMVDAASDDDFEELKFDEKEFEELRKAADDPSMERWVLGGFTGIAMLMILVSVIASFLNIQKLAKEESVPGRVVGVTVQRLLVNQKSNIVRDFYYPVIEFTPLNGHTRTLQVNTGSDSPYYEKGDEVTVAYDPNHPLDARIQSAGGNALMWILPGITGVLGIAFAGAVFIVKKVMAV